MKRTNQGFTLIELIIVIVILGILAVSAAPRFVDVAADARVSVIDGMRGSVQGAASITNSRAIIRSLASGTAYFDENNNNTKDAGEIGLVNGFPDAESLEDTLDLADGDWQVRTNSAGTITRIFPTGVEVGTNGFDGATAPAVCYLEYNEAVAGNRPVITATATTTTGC